MSNTLEQSKTELQTFIDDVNIGLSKPKKALSSKYFYDDEGSRIFQQIMDMPEYYLTNSEYEILNEQADAIFEALNFKTHFNIIEFGAGDGAKTKNLLQWLLDHSVDFTYVPVDISKEAIFQLETNLKKALPTLKIKPIIGDYFQVLKENLSANNDPNLLLFLGSNIGNFYIDDAIGLLSKFKNGINIGDKLLIGIDLQKNPITIQKAYFDDGKITKAFNLNLLKRMNKELGANFDLDQFDFYSNYNPENGEVRSCLVSLCEQTVYITALDKEFHFANGEMISTELSKKYTLPAIEQLAVSSGFQVKKNFLDSNKYFADSLWEVVE